MGGKFMLITYQNVVDRNNALVNHVIKWWFHSLKHWKGDAASLLRLIWLNIRGMPLNAWELKSFKKIAESWGEFLVLNQEMLSMDSFDVGRLLIVTNCKYKIDEWINVIVKGRNYQVQVWEEECNDPFDVKGANHDHQFCSINRLSHNPAKDSASHVDIQSKDKDVEKANSLHKEVEEAVNQKDNFDNLETLAHDVPARENLLLDSGDRHAMPDERDANEVLFNEVVGSQNPLSANSVSGNQEPHSAEVVQETLSQRLKENEANKQAFTEEGTLKNVSATHVEPANKERETQRQSGNAAISGEHALMDSGHNKSNNAVDKQVVISTNEPLNEECEPSKNEITEVCPHADFFENNDTSIQVQ
ncbi:hypothetical protein Vadar_009323 [Vaccinium darrowii]|uniref:Uncharacterized protein n=1 Tax=Vaccinium darrowii TaxID=229202 RepID=A0ACB7Y5L2_9ERIC|nr:hypothetical protein Vadar_009323 [Vaccinium darrowii]